MEYKYILYEVTDRTLLITFNRPDKLNAMPRAMHFEIIDALDRAEADDNIRVIIFTGAGRGFSAGTDLSEDAFDNSHVAPEDHRDEGGLVALRLYEMKKPTIAAINGAAVGVGITMTLPMDIRIASTKARMGFVFAGRGIINEACSGYFLPRIVGISQAMEWVLSAQIFDAQEALRGGLISRVLEDDELLPSAFALAQNIAENTSAVSVAVARQLCWRMLAADHPMDSHELESLVLQWIGTQPDAVEGTHAFREKRPPHFTMSAAKDMPPFYPWWPQRTFRNR